MSVIVTPNIEVDNIELLLDDNNQYGADKFIGEQGRNIPVIKIGDYILNTGDLEQFELKVALNSLPTFSMTVNDELYVIRENLKNDIDKCVIFIGFKDWYIKFNGILNKTYSDVGDVSIELTGKVWNDKLYNTKQLIFKDLTVKDILKQLCEETSMGLFGIDNPDFNKTIEYSIMPNIKYIEFIESTIKKYTKNLFAFDCFYFLHVADIDKLKSQPIDKYSLNWKDGISMPEKDIIFKSISRDGSDEESDDDFKIPIDYYSIDTNFTDVHGKTSNKYFLNSVGTQQTEIPSKDNLGIGESNDNTFFGFESLKFPFYNEIVNKKLAGNIIKIKTNTVIFELVPFSVVGLELYLPFNITRDIKLDEEHSGTKIVIGYTIEYNKSEDDSKSFMSQTIEMI
jgi:hypothetical protein